jgi:hypothetical protein
VDGRVFQWSNALAENTIFFVYTITNVSEKALDTLFSASTAMPIWAAGLRNTDDNGSSFLPTIRWPRG